MIGRATRGLSMDEDEQTALLKEIRDILHSQNDLVDAQWKSYERTQWMGQAQWWSFLVLQAILLFYLFGRA